MRREQLALIAPEEEKTANVKKISQDMRSKQSFFFCDGTRIFFLSPSFCSHVLFGTYAQESDGSRKATGQPQPNFLWGGNNFGGYLREITHTRKIQTQHKN